MCFRQLVYVVLYSSLFNLIWMVGQPHTFKMLSYYVYYNNMPYFSFLLHNEDIVHSTASFSFSQKKKKKEDKKRKKKTKKFAHI